MKAFKLFLYRKADLKAKDAKSNSPLLAAVYEGHLEVYNHFLQSMTPEVLDDSLDDSNDRGQTVVHVAAELGHADLLKVIQTPPPIPHAHPNHNCCYCDFSL